MNVKCHRPFLGCVRLYGRDIGSLVAICYGLADLVVEQGIRGIIDNVYGEIVCGVWLLLYNSHMLDWIIPLWAKRKMPRT